MKVSIAFIQTCLISLILSSCASRAPSMRMLDKRANYDNLDDETIFMNQKLSREKSREVKIYVYPNEMPNGDYFQGGYIRALLDKGRWTYKQTKSIRR